MVHYARDCSCICIEIHVSVYNCISVYIHVCTCCCIALANYELSACVWLRPHMAFMVTYNEEEEEGEEGEGERITQGMCLPRAITVYVFSVVSM